MCGSIVLEHGSFCFIGDFERERGRRRCPRERIQHQQADRNGKRSRGGTWGGKWSGGQDLGRGKQHRAQEQVEVRHQI